jgi:anti-sigma factor RsiW
MLNGHLDDDMVLLLTTGELDSQLAERAEKHLEACAACRKKLEDTSSFRLHLKEALQRREASQREDEAIFKNRLEQSRPLSLRWIAAAAGIAALVSWTIVPHRLQAKDVWIAPCWRKDRIAPRLIWFACVRGARVVPSARFRWRGSPPLARGSMTAFNRYPGIGNIHFQ